MRILIYTFYTPRTTAFKVVSSITHLHVSKYYVGSLRVLCHKVLEGKYDYVIGIGNFRKGTRKIRIEQKFINKYGKKRIIENGINTYNPTHKIATESDVYFSDKASNGPCNRSAYVLSHYITQNNLKTKVAFAHIPKDFNIDRTYELLSKWVSDIEQI